MNVTAKKRISVKDLTKEQRLTIEDFFTKDVTLYKKWLTVEHHLPTDDSFAQKMISYAKKSIRT